MRVLSFTIIAAVVFGRGITAHLGSGYESQEVLKPSTEKGLKGGSFLNTLAASIREDAQSPASCAACEVSLHPRLLKGYIY